MFDGRWRSTFERGLRPIGAHIKRTGVTANHLTTTGLVMAMAASFSIAQGWLRAGLLLLVLTAVPDVLDGAVAKASGTASPRGAFFDSVIDRVSDALRMGGVAWYLASTQPGRVAVLPLAVLAASMLISYERAKAESLGFTAKGGIMERAERMVLLSVGLAFDILVPVLWVMVALSAITAVHRFGKVWRQATPERPRRTERTWSTRVAGIGRHRHVRTPDDVELAGASRRFGDRWRRQSQARAARRRRTRP
jgi:CDP-diacylglycerol---glycerol-3-phosphate 3-phosphatidyltransferase